MDLKQSLQDYTEHEFLELTRRLSAVDVKKQDHDRLIEHFDNIVEYPDAIDFIFHPSRMNNVNAPMSVLRTVVQWCAANGKPGPKPAAGGSLTATTYRPRPAIPSGYTPAAKLARSRQQLEEGHALAADVATMHQSASLALGELEHRIAQLQSLPLNSEPIVPSTVKANALPDHVEPLLRMELQTNFKVGDFERVQARVEAFYLPAKMNLSSSMHDAATQALVFQNAQAVKTQFTSQLSALKHRQAIAQQKLADYLVSAEEQLMRRMALSNWGPGKVASTLTATPGNIAQRVCLLSVDDEASYFFDQQGFSLQQSLRSVIAEFNWMAEASVDEEQVACATLIQFHSVIGNRERLGVSVPLTEMVQVEQGELQAAAAVGGTVNVPVRIGFGDSPTAPFKLARATRELKDFCTAFAVTCSGSVQSAVRVRAASWCSERRGYCFTSQGAGASTLVWRKAGSLDDPLPPVPDLLASPPRVSAVHTYQIPRVETVVHPQDLHFEDYVIVFPQVSGLEPVYVAIKGCETLPGVASGDGEHVGSDWLQIEPLDRDAAIPGSVARRMRGRVFEKFSDFKKAFWIEVAQDEELSGHFTQEDLSIMAEGRGPLLGTDGLSSSFSRFEIYHIDPVSEDGDAYDMDNMSIMTSDQRTAMLRMIDQFDR